MRQSNGRDEAAKYSSTRKIDSLVGLTVGLSDDQFEQDRDAPSQKSSAPDEPTVWQWFI
jgi:hypothetical protein